MRTKNDYYKETLQESFEYCGLSATPEQIDLIANDISNAVENESLAFYSPNEYDSGPTKEDLKNKIKSLEDEINSLKEENRIYSNSVKRRRNAERVWIEDNTVFYE